MNESSTHEFQDMLGEDRPMQTSVVKKKVVKRAVGEEDSKVFISVIGTMLQCLKSTLPVLLDNGESEDSVVARGDSFD